MIFGEIFFVDGEIIFNVDWQVIMLMVVNIGDCLVQVGSYYYFVEINLGFDFDRKVVWGMWLDIVVGIVVCFEFGQQCEVLLIFLVGDWKVFGFNVNIMGVLD